MFSAGLWQYWLIIFSVLSIRPLSLTPLTSTLLLVSPQTAWTTTLLNESGKLAYSKKKTPQPAFIFLGYFQGRSFQQSSSQGMSARIAVWGNRAGQCAAGQRGEGNANSQPQSWAVSARGILKEIVCSKPYILSVWGFVWNNLQDFLQ